VANSERKSLVVLGKRPRLDFTYEILLVLVAIGGSAWIIRGIGDAPALASGLDAGGNAVLKGIICAAVVLLAAYLLEQTFLLNGRFGLVYGLVRDGAVYLAAPEGVIGSRKKRLLCDGTVTMAVRTDSTTRGSSSTPSTRFRFESGGGLLVVQSGAPVGEPGEAEAAIRSWLKAHGISVKDVPYPARGPAPAA
jgi:hypothetical protein